MLSIYVESPKTDCSEILSKLLRLSYTRTKANKQSVSGNHYVRRHAIIYTHIYESAIIKHRKNNISLYMYTSIRYYVYK